MALTISPQKRKFQLERMIFFSDAVFAIAITLLVIELKVPPITEPVTDTRLLQALIDLTPKIFGFVLSFFLIGLYWTVHHRLFGFAIDYTPRLLWINLIFLFGIVCLPFTTSFYSEYLYTHLKTPLILYSLNFCYIGIFSFVLHNYVTSPKRHLTEGLDKDVAGYFAFRAIAIPIIFLAIIIVSLFSTVYALFIPPLTPLIMWILAKIYKKGKRLKNVAA